MATRSFHGKIGKTVGRNYLPLLLVLDAKRIRLLRATIFARPVDMGNGKARVGDLIFYHGHKGERRAIITRIEMEGRKRQLWGRFYTPGENPKCDIRETWLPENEASLLAICPRCEERPVVESDYLCEACRYG
jgi:hypothetical protein